MQGRLPMHNLWQGVVAVAEPARRIRFGEAESIPPLDSWRRGSGRWDRSAGGAACALQGHVSGENRRLAVQGGGCTPSKPIASAD